MARQAMNEDDQIDESRSARNKQVWNGNVEESRGQDRQQSKVDDAFQAIHDRLDSLGNTTQNLQDRLSIVTNNYPRESDTSPMKPKDVGPTGDSELLNRLYEVSEKLSRQIVRINETLGRLDI